MPGMLRILVLLLPWCAGLSGVAHAELQDVYAIGESYKISRDGAKVFSVDPINLAALKQKNLIWNSAAKLISLTGARGETLAFQCVLEPDANGANDLDVSISDLNGPGDSIKKTNAELFKEWYVEARSISNENNAPSTGTGWYPDALVPWEVKDHGKYKGPPFSIEHGQIQAVWVDLHIPPEAKGGLYKGSIEVLSGGKARFTLALELRVFHFALPQETHNLFFMNADVGDICEAGSEWLTGGTRAKKIEGAVLKYEDECYRLARAHRFAWGNMYFEGYRDRPSVFPKIETNANGEITSVDWSAYDARFGRVLDPKNNIFGPGQSPIEIWRLPIGILMSNENTWDKNKGKLFPKEGRAWEQFPQWIKKHWEEKGWPLDNTYVYLADEPSQHDLPKLEEFARKLAAATTPPLHSQIAILTDAKNFQSYFPEFQKRFGGVLDRWMWSANSIDPKALEGTLRESDKLGCYQGNEPYLCSDVLDKDGLALRTWSWIAWLYNLKYMCNYSCTEFGPINAKGDLNKCVWENPVTRPNGNLLRAQFVYPGDYVNCNSPIASIRMKQVRRGQQDYEYMWLLAQRGKRAGVDTAVRKIVVKALAEAAEKPNAVGTKGAWDRDPEHWDQQIQNWGKELDQ